MKQKYNSRFLMVAIHVLIWVIVFSLPLFSWSGGDEPFVWRKYFGFALLPIFFMIVFYLNYFILVDKLLFRKKTVWYVLVNLLVISAAVMILNFWHESGFVRQSIPADFRPADLPPGFMEGSPRPGGPRPDGFGKREMGMLFRDGTMLLLMAGLALAIRMTMQWFKTEREKQALEAAQAKAELKNLKNQLNPHFLFNTLNNIYSLIEFNPDKARYAVESLSRMLRHVLYDNDQEIVPIEHEFAFMRSYIELMALRLTPSSTLEIDIPEKGNGIMIAPLLFINSVENAFKHGISTKKPSFIRISIRVVDFKRVECIVENSYFPRVSEHSGSGIGQENLKRRLSLLYPDSHELVNEQRGDTYYSSIVIHL